MLNYELAKDYRNRARKIIEVFVAMSIPGNKPKPDEKTMEELIDELPDILNWMGEGARKMGIPFEPYAGPLTEEQMCEVEKRIVYNAEFMAAGCQAGLKYLNQR
jgi:hypothetical protein